MNNEVLQAGQIDMAVDRNEQACERQQVVIDDDGVTVKFGGYDYFIEWSRINTQQKLLQWVWHLAEKLWMDRRRMRIFIEKVEDHFGWDVRTVV